MTLLGWPKKLKRFDASKRLGEEFVKRLGPKIIKHKLDYVRAHAAEHNHQKKCGIRCCLKRINSGSRNCRFYGKR